MIRRMKIPGRGTSSSLLFFLLAFVLVVPGFAQPRHGQPGERMRGPGRDAPRGSEARGPGLPTVAEMAASVDADAEQRAALAEARLAFFEALEGRPDGSPEARMNGRPGRDRHAGPRVERGGGPFEVFLVKAGQALSVDQMSSLIDLLETRTPGPAMGGREGRHRGGGPRGQFGPGERCGQAGPQGLGEGGPRGHRDRGPDPLLEALDLSADQRSRVQVLRASTGAALRALAAQVEPGTEPSPELRSRMQGIRDDYQAKLEEILGAEKMAKLEDLRDARRSERSEKAEARWKEGRAQHLAMLEAVLDLKPRQRAAIEKVLDEAHERMTDARMQRWEEGGPMAALWTERGNDREAIDQAIVEQLEPAQREVFAKLRTLRRLAPPVHRQGPRGHRG